MRQYKNSFTVIFLIISCLKLAALELPFDVPADENGLESHQIAQELNYHLKMEIELTENHKTDQLLLPLPPAFQFQKITLKSVEGCKALEVKRDQLGNYLLICQKAQDLIKMDFEVTLSRIKLSQMPHYKRDMGINKTFLDNLIKQNKKFLPKSSFSANIDQNIGPEQLDQLCVAFRDYQNKFRPADKKLYVFYSGWKESHHKRIYPHPLSEFKKAAFELISFLAENNIGACILAGINAPKGTEIMNEDFAVQVFLSEGKTVLLDRYLNSFVNHNASLFYAVQDPEFSDKRSPFFSAQVKQDSLEFLDCRLHLGYGESLSDPRYTEYFISFEGIKKADIASSAYIMEIDQLDKPLLVYRKSPKKIYENASVMENIDDFTLCRGVSNNKPFNKTAEFYNGQRIYAWLHFKGPTPRRLLGFRWIAPSGKVYSHTSKQINTRWSSYYTYIGVNTKWMEAGEWTLEISYNGKLEIRQNFIIH